MIRLRKCRVDKSGCYGTLAIALRELKAIRARSTRDVKPIRAYPCDLGCRAWHLTSQPARPYQRVPRRRR